MIYCMERKLFCYSGSSQLCQSVKASFVSLTINMSSTEEGRTEQEMGKKENIVHTK